jgi:hypothetical protein
VEDSFGVTELHRLSTYHTIFDLGTFSLLAQHGTFVANKYAASLQAIPFVAMEASQPSFPMQ